jgi:molybdate transport system ATP-binding protein
MSVRISGAVSHGDFELDISTTLEPGVVVAVIGPNGSGKSTLLRTVAGLQLLTSGTVEIDGRVVDDGRTAVRPQDRSVGVVFQDYALFPHLSLRDNVAFGPRARGTSRREADERAQAILDRLGIGELADRRPAQVSGGQAQRTALARALATTPRVLLLDEPLSALDVETRDGVRAELDTVLAGFDGCTLLVTHDPLDAMVLADRVLVLENGRVVQDGSPADLALRPATAYVAALMGVTLLRGTIREGVLEVDGGGVLHSADRDAQGRVLCVVRPEAVTLHLTPPEGSARNVWQGTVAALQPSHDRVRVVVEGYPGVTAAVTPSAVAELGLARGVDVWLSMKAVDVTVHPSPAH